MCGWLFTRALRKHKQITDPIIGATYQETYCSISLNILYWVRIMVVLQIVYCFLEVVEYSIGKLYAKLVFNDDFSNCKPGSQLNFNLYFLLRLVLVYQPALGILFYLLLL